MVHQQHGCMQRPYGMAYMRVSKLHPLSLQQAMQTANDNSPFFAYIVGLDMLT